MASAVPRTWHRMMGNAPTERRTRGLIILRETTIATIARGLVLKPRIRTLQLQITRATCENPPNHTTTSSLFLHFIGTSVRDYVCDKLVYQLSVDEGNRRREGDNS